MSTNLDNITRKRTGTIGKSERIFESKLDGNQRTSKKGEGVIGSNTESHVSHVLSSRESSRPMGWSKEGLEGLTQLRIAWKNGMEMKEIVANRKKEEKKEGEERWYSCEQILIWERKNKIRNGKYQEALQVTTSWEKRKRDLFSGRNLGIMKKNAHWIRVPTASLQKSYAILFELST